MPFVGSVHAAQAESPEQTATVFSKSYRFNSSVSNVGTGVASSVLVDVESQDSVPTGYIGVNARLYNTSGSLVQSSGLKYNDRAIYMWIVPTNIHYTKGTYYGKGRFLFYNGNGYTEYFGVATPNIQNSMTPMFSKEMYKVNEYGLTYGSDFHSESPKDSPDLIRVIGKNGIEGYVYSEDINLELNTLDKVLDYINSGQTEYSVPVYTEDGITVIDTFEIKSAD